MAYITVSRETTPNQQVKNHLLPSAASCQLVIPEEAAWDESWHSATAALDLQVYVQPPQSWLQRWLWRAPAQQLVEQTKRTLLILHQPHWPLRHILFVVRAEESDWTAFTWLERLARPRQTTVTVLPIVPPWPRFHRMSAYAQPTPEVLLAPNTVSGAMLRQMVHRLDQREIPTTLALSTGEPIWRMRAAVAACPPQLIVIAAESHHRLLRHLYGELVKPLVQWLPCPLLITR